jgi:hypothetical protein
LASVTVVGATTNGTVLLNCPQPVQASMAIAAATRIGKSLAGFGPVWRVWKLASGTLEALFSREDRRVPLRRTTAS